jgi:two-component system, chemotaxis family, chemotaxis protein CheY
VFSPPSHLSCYLRTMKSIIIVDDETNDFIVHRKMIEKAGYTGEITHFSSAETTLTFLRGTLNNLNAWPEYIFVDINMPFMGGYEFIEQLAQFPLQCLNQSKIIILTASSSPEDLKTANLFPLIKFYIEKPLTIDKVYRIFSL